MKAMHNQHTARHLDQEKAINMGMIMQLKTVRHNKKYFCMTINLYVYQKIRQRMSPPGHAKLVPVFQLLS